MSATVGVSDKTMFEIYRETDYNRAFHFVFYTDLEEHARDDVISKAASGDTVFSGFIDDTQKEAAREVIAAMVDELNDMHEDDAGISKSEVERRLAKFLVPDGDKG